MKTFLMLFVFLAACAKSIDSLTSTVDDTYLFYTESVNDIVIYHLDFSSSTKARFFKATYSKSTGLTMANDSDQKCLSYSKTSNIAEIAGLNSYPDGSTVKADLSSASLTFLSYPDLTFPFLIESYSKNSDKKDFIKSLSVQGLIDCK